MGSMVVDDTLQMIESVLSKEDLVQIQEKYIIPESIGLKLLGPPDRVTTRLATRVALYKEVLKAGLRLLLPSVVAELL